MKEVIGDVWAYEGRKGFKIMIPTNGYIKNNGEGVMGAGVARQAADRYPDLPRLLGISLKRRGNEVSMLTQDLYSFPTKHKWTDPAHLKLIKVSIKSLMKIAKTNPEIKYILPRPGCGNGGLKYSVVKPLLKELPNNVFVICKDGDV